MTQEIPDTYPPMPEHAWIFPANWRRVVDGDTIDVEIDAGFHGRQIERLRLWGVNAPEMRGETLKAAQAARAYVTDWLEDADTGLMHDGFWPLVLKTTKADAFGRYLAIVWRRLDGRCLNEDLLLNGHAVEDIR